MSLRSDPKPAPTSGIGCLLLLVPLALAIGSCGVLGSGEGPSVEGESHLSSVPSSVTIVRDWVWPALASASVAAVFVLALLARFKPSRWLPPPLLMSVATVIVLLLVGIGYSSYRHGRVGAWTIWDERIAPDTRRFAVLKKSVFIESVTILAAERVRGPFAVHYDGLAGMLGRDQRLQIFVRPDAERDKERNVWFGAGGVVIAADGDGCWAAWDDVRHRALSRDEILRLSPFLLLGDTEPGRESDVDAIIADPDRTRDAALAAAFDHANPWVRDAARRIVEAGGERLHPEARRRLPPK